MCCWCSWCDIVIYIIVGVFLFATCVCWWLSWDLLCLKRFHVDKSPVFKKSMASFKGELHSKIIQSQVTFLGWLLKRPTQRWGMKKRWRAWITWSMILRDDLPSKKNENSWPLTLGDLGCFVIRNLENNNNWNTKMSIVKLQKQIPTWTDDSWFLSRNLGGWKIPENVFVLNLNSQIIYIPWN